MIRRKYIRKGECYWAYEKGRIRRVQVVSKDESHCVTVREICPSCGLDEAEPMLGIEMFEDLDEVIHEAEAELRYIESTIEMLRGEGIWAPRKVAANG